MRYVGTLFAGFAAYYLARGIGIPTWTAFTPGDDTHWMPLPEPPQ